MKNNQITESGNNEWYTPKEHVDTAKDVMGGIDLDPASNDLAQSYIKAKQYFTEKDDGLTRKWIGKVWLNPPYSRGLMDKFIEKLVGEKEVSSYICLVNSSTDTKWCHLLMDNADAMCLTKGRISFLDENGVKSKGNSRGQIFFYKGNNNKGFSKEFSRYGKVLQLKNL